MRFNPVLSLVLFSVLSGPLALAQQPESGPPPPPQPSSVPGQRPRPMEHDRRDHRPEGMRPDFRIAPPGMWWKSPDLIQKLNLTPDQQKRMDDIFQQSRLQLLDLKAAVEKQEVLLGPMLTNNPPDTNKILAQIDRTAQARAELEKGNARMLLGIRGVLTPDQWTRLQAEERENRRTMVLRRFKRPDSQGKPHGSADNGDTPKPPSQ